MFVGPALRPSVAGMGFDERYQDLARRDEQGRRAIDAAVADLRGLYLVDEGGAATAQAQTRLEQYCRAAAPRFRQAGVPQIVVRVPVGPRLAWVVGSDILAFAEDPPMLLVRLGPDWEQLVVRGVITQYPSEKIERDALGSGLWFVRTEDDFVANFWFAQGERPGFGIWPVEQVIAGRLHLHGQGL